MVWKQTKGSFNLFLNLSKIVKGLIDYRLNVLWLQHFLSVMCLCFHRQPFRFLSIQHVWWYHILLLLFCLSCTVPGPVIQMYTVLACLVLHCSVLSWPVLLCFVFFVLFCCFALFVCHVFWFTFFYQRLYITKTCLYNFDPVKAHFYIVKLEFKRVYIILSYFFSNHRLWVLVRTDNVEAVLTRTHNLCFKKKKYKKISEFLSENFQFWWWKFQYIWIGEFS